MKYFPHFELKLYFVVSSFCQSESEVETEICSVGNDLSFCTLSVDFVFEYWKSPTNIALATLIIGSFGVEKCNF